MADRFFGINFDQQPESSTGGSGGNIASGSSTTGKDIEVRINMGTGSPGSPAYDFIRTQRGAMIAKLQQIVDELQSGKLAWPPV